MSVERPFRGDRDLTAAFQFFKFVFQPLHRWAKTLVHSPRFPRGVRNCGGVAAFYFFEQRLQKRTVVSRTCVNK